MYGILLSIHILICFATILVVLLQSGKGGGLAGAFGGGGSTIFGGRGAGTILTRATMVLGALFFVTSLSLALLSSPRTSGAGRSLLQEEAKRSAGAQPTQGQQPLVPGQTAPGQTTPGQTAPATLPAAGQTPPPAGGTTPAKAPATTPPAAPGGTR
jgi:preprotein translocase subunit SecG